MRAIVAAAAFVLLTLLLILAILAVRVLGRKRAQRWAGRLSMLYSRINCALIGLRRHVVGRPAAGPVLVVANHVSWADVLVVTATVPAIFVAKREVGAWPLIGWIAKVRGTVFVDRGRRHQTAEANAEIAARLASGAVVVLFGEGTSADGDRVLPFRSSLLGALGQALHADGTTDIAVQPLALSYTRLRGLPMGRRQRPVAAWIGDLELVSHVRGLIARGPVDVTLSFGEPLLSTAGGDRKARTRALEAAVRSMHRAALRAP